MSYAPNTDFVALWRNQTGGAAKGEMPSLDFMIATLDRAGLIHVTFSETQPIASQPTTMWFRPAIPTYIGEGVLYLWEASSSSYKIATPTLFAAYLLALGA